MISTRRPNAPPVESTPPCVFSNGPAGIRRHSRTLCCIWSSASFWSAACRNSSRRRLDARKIVQHKARRQRRSEVAVGYEYAGIGMQLVTKAEVRPGLLCHVGREKMVARNGETGQVSAEVWLTENNSGEQPIPTKPNLEPPCSSPRNGLLAYRCSSCVVQVLRPSDTTNIMRLPQSMY
jgi:hypothetical protein